MESHDETRWTLADTLPTTKPVSANKIGQVSGIFAKERCWRLHQRLTSAALDAQKQLWKMSCAGSRSADRRVELFAIGLDLLSDASPREMQMLAQRIIDQHPDVLSDYRYTLLEYVRLLYDDADENLEVVVNRPTFDAFLRAFYRHLATYTTVRSSEWLRNRLSTGEARELVAQAMRCALADCGVAEVRRRPCSGQTTIQPAPQQFDTTTTKASKPQEVSSSHKKSVGVKKSQSSPVAQEGDDNRTTITVNKSVRASVDARSEEPPNEKVVVVSTRVASNPSASLGDKKQDKLSGCLASNEVMLKTDSKIEALFPPVKPAAEISLNTEPSTPKETPPKTPSNKPRRRKEISEKQP